MACWTEDEIAEREGITQKAVNEIVSEKIPNLEKGIKASADFADPVFYVPITARSTSPNPSMPDEMPSSISPGPVQDLELRSI